MTPEIIDAMVSAGVSVDVLAAAWKAHVEQLAQAAKIAAEMAEARAERVRKLGAERQRKLRLSRNVTRDNASPSVTPRDPSPLTPPLKFPPNPLQITPPISPQPSDSAGARTSLVDFVEWRKSIRKAMTPKAIELAESKLAKLEAAGHDRAAVIEQSILNQWTGLFPVKEESIRYGKSGHDNRAPDNRGIRNQMLRILVGEGVDPGAGDDDRRSQAGGAAQHREQRGATITLAANREKT